MAEAFLNVLLENLNSLVQRRIGLLLGIDKEMQKFSSTLSTISAVLEDAEEKQLTDRSIKNWLQKLSDLSFELDDALDDCDTEAFRLEHEGEKMKWSQKVRSSLSCLMNPRNVLFRYEIAKRTKEIGDRLDQIADERMKFHLREAVGERRDQLGLRGRPETSSIVTEPCVYGREEDKEKIVGFLVNDARNCEDLSVYSIVGLGGMGKTTLAQLVYNDERVDKHFEVKMWVCVSEDFDVKRLVKAIIESATGTGCEALDMDPLQKRLQEILMRKRFLLVLDDVWNEDEEQWDKLKYVLACGSNGASIVVTTRLQKAASFMGTVPMHHLSGLSEDDCWLLFKQRAFGNQGEERPNLMKIGKEIVRKCKGVPLAAKALGGLMRFKREEHEWLSVKQSELWNLPQDKSSILPALRLSYFHLSIEQRRCFAYCAVFPKDYRIGKEQLIHLWMANGLVSSKRGLDAEDIGDEIVNELYWRSFIQDIEKADVDDISHFKMHDLVHDLAQSIMEDECSILGVDQNTHPINLSKRVRHLTCCTSRESQSLILDIPYAKSLRTFMVLNNQTTSCSFNVKFSSLRAFDAPFIRSTTHMPTLIGNFKHLRYLNLSRSGIKILPVSICFLSHLLTLDVSRCHSLHKLPKHISRLKSLRHLYIDGCVKLSHMPPHIGRLTCLKILTKFIVSQRQGCHLDELCHLNIGGVLGINNLEKVRSSMEATSSNLSSKTNLKTLELSWSANENESEDNDEQVLEALAPPQNLKSLSIFNYKGTLFPNWFSNEILGNVVRITLSSCKNCSELPPLGRLTSLRDLKISVMKFVRCMDNESYDGDLTRGFMHLEALHLEDLPNLERLSREEGKEIFPRLSKLYVDKCPKLTLPGPLGKLKSLQDLKISGMKFVRCMDNESYDGDLTRGSMHLEALHLEDLPNLERLSREEGKEIFPRLSTLSVDKCPKLTLPRLGLVKDLTIYEGHELLLKSISGLHALTGLHISENDNIAFFPQGMLQNLTALKWLRIDRFKKLQELPPDMLITLTALEDLDVSFCHELRCLPERIPFPSPTSLKHIKIKSCKKLKSLSDSFRDLTALQSLDLVDCPELEGFPSCLNRLSSLQRLTMWGAEVESAGRNGYHCSFRASQKLVALPEALRHLPSIELMAICYILELVSLPDWLGNLASLRELYIIDCPDLTYIPANIQSLSNLRKLSIESCPKLERQYEKEVGEHWHKISHIPDVYVGPGRWPPPYGIP